MYTLTHILYHIWHYIIVRHSIRFSVQWSLRHFNDISFEFLYRSSMMFIESVQSADGGYQHRFPTGSHKQCLCGLLLHNRCSKWFQRRFQITVVCPLAHQFCQSLCLPLTSSTNNWLAASVTLDSNPGVLNLNLNLQHIEDIRFYELQLHPCPCFNCCSVKFWAQLPAKLTDKVYTVYLLYWLEELAKLLCKGKFKCLYKIWY